MRIYHKIIVDITNNKKIAVFCDYNKAIEKMQELKNENPKNEYKIVYKWGNI
jgi:hypothetical protein